MRSKLTPEIEAAALSDLAGGEQPAVVAERYKLNPATVRSWKKRQRVAYVIDATADATESATADAPVPQSPPAVVRPQEVKRRRQVGELILDLLVAKIEASEAIAKAASNPQWLDRQSGSELAILGGWLDTTAFAIGDRLAASSVQSEFGADPDSDDTSGE